MTESNLIRINKFLSEIGYCSRRAADTLVEEGRVKVNGVIAVMGAKVGSSDVIMVDDKIVSRPNEDFVYIAFNKPVGIVCTTDVANEKDNIVDYINHPQRIFPVGRLDKLSEGLILLTSDGDIVNKILRSKNNHEKEYIVTVDRPISDEFIDDMSNGVPILGTTTKKCFVEKLDRFRFRIILTQGLNRQIRRMCEYFGYEVTKLKRIRIMHIELDMPPGKWRDLTSEELAELNRLVEHSTKTYE
jgi:23S rRNA pseudouridine2604 synthase